METRHKILILDDDVDWLELSREMLSSMPSRPEIMTANSGKRALAILESEPVRLLICDLKMPRIDGLQILAIVRRRFPELRFARSLWSPSYFVASVGAAPLTVLRQYIEQQARPL